MSTFVVHANADQHFHAFEVVPTVLFAFGQFSEVVHQTVRSLEVVDLAFLGGIVVDYFCAVGSYDFREVFAQWSTAIGYDEAFVKARTAENVEWQKRLALFLLHLRCDNIIRNSAAPLSSITDSLTKLPNI
jgi:hypothetical protein